jgi:hypothetical protein
MQLHQKKIFPSLEFKKIATCQPNAREPPFDPEQCSDIITTIIEGPEKISSSSFFQGKPQNLRV